MAVMNVHDPIRLIDQQRQEFALLKNLRQHATPRNKALWAEKCRENLLFIHDYVSKYGWPPASVVDEDGENAAFLMTQHGDAKGLLGGAWTAQATQMQKDILRAMQKDGATPGYIAFVTDRVRYNQGKPQLYGTIPEPQYPVDQPEGLEARRSQMGLKETQAEYLLRMQKGDHLPFRPLLQDPDLLRFWDEEEKESDTITHGKNYDIRAIIKFSGAILGVIAMFTGFPMLGLGVIFTSIATAPYLARKYDEMLDRRDERLERSQVDRSPVEPSLQPAHYHHKIDYSQDPDHPAHRVEIMGHNFANTIEKQRAGAISLEKT